MPELTRQCPTCKKKYESSQVYCQLDGTQLVEMPTVSSPFEELDPDVLVSQSAAIAEASQDSNASHPQKWYSKIPKETKAGLLVFVALLALVAVVFAFRQSNIFSLKLYLDEGHGIEAGDAVFLKGVDVGKVTSIGFENDLFAANLAIRPDISNQIHKDSMFFVDFEKIAVQKRCVHIVIFDSNSPLIPSGSSVEGENSLLKAYLYVLREKGIGMFTDFVAEMKTIGLRLPNEFDELKGLVPLPFMN